MTVLVMAPLSPSTIMDMLEARFTLLPYWGTAEHLKPNASSLDAIEAVITTGIHGLPRSVMDILPNLRLISVFGVGYDKIDINETKARDIAVTLTPDILTDAVAETALALTLSAARQITLGDRFIRNKEWPTSSFGLGRSLHHKTIGIVGYGNIGRATAALLAPFSPRILYNTRTEPDEFDPAYRKDTVELAKESDILIVTASGHPSNTHMINRDVMEALGENGLLVNISRGHLVDETALIDCLETGVLGSAALDVFEKEPHVPEALMAMNNVVLAPHIGSATLEARLGMGKLVYDNVCAYFEGKPLLTPLD